MKINKLTKRIVSFITALSLSVSSTVMVLPANAFADNSQEIGYTDIEENKSDELFGDLLDNYDLDDEDETQYITVTASSTEHGSVIIPNSNPESETQVDFYLQPDDGYKIGNIAVTYGDNQTVQYYESEVGEYYFTAPSENVTITATFVLCNVTFKYKTVDNDGNTDEIGNAFTVSMSNGTSLSNGDTFTIEDLPLSVSFSPVRGYQANWLDIYENEASINGSSCIYQGSLGGVTSLTLYKGNLQILNDDCERVFVAEFGISDDEYNVNLNIENGTADVNDSYTFTEKVCINYISPDDGYELDTITAKYTDEDGVQHSIDIQRDDDDTPYFIMPAYDVDVTVAFKLKKYDVKLQEAEGVTYSVTTVGDNVLKDGDKITINDFPLTLTATVTDNKYTFDSWDITNGDYTADLEQTMTVTGMSDWSEDSITISVNLEGKPSFSVTAAPNSGITIAAYGETNNFSECYKDNTVYFTVSVPDGYIAKNIRAYNDDNLFLLDTSYNKEGNYYYFTMPAGDVIIMADVVKLHKVTVNATNGTITAYNDSSFTDIVSGDTVYFKLTPADGYFWYSDNFGNLLTLSTSNSSISWESDCDDDGTEYYYFEMPDEDVTISISFPEKTKWVKENGKYSITYREDYPSVPLQIPLSELIAEGRNVNDIESITLKHTNNAMFYVLISGYSDTSEESVNQTETTININGVQISADDAICINSIILDNNNETFTISDITINYKKYNIETSADNCSVTASAAKAENGDTITVTVTPDEGYRIEKLYYSYTENNKEKTVKIENNEFVMPAFNVTIYAECEQYTFTATDGDIVKYCDDFTELTNLCNDIFKNKDVTLTINKNFVLTSKEKLPSTVNSLKINGSGKLQPDNSVTALNIPVDTILNVTIEPANTLAVTVAAGKTLTLGTDYNGYINKLSGGTDSMLVVNKELEIGQLSKFAKVAMASSVADDMLIIRGTVSSIGSIEGKICLCDTSDITYAAENTKLYLMLKADGSLPKVTLTDSGKIGLTFLKDIGNYTEVAAGTTVLYTKGKDLSDKISISSFTAVYYEKTKEIKAEYAGAVTLSKKSGDNWEAIKDFPNLETAVDYINGNTEDTTPEYGLLLNKEMSASSTFAFPTKNKNVKSITLNGQAITFTGTKLNIPYDTVIGCSIKAENKTNKLDVSVAKDVKLTLYVESFKCLGKVTGTNTSELFIDHTTAYFTDLSGFGKVSGAVVIDGTMSKIGNYSGELAVTGEKSTVDITNVSGSTTFNLVVNSKGVLPKVTIGKASENSTIKVYVGDSSGGNITLNGGETVLYTKDNKFAEDGLLENVTFGTTNRYLSAFYYSKTKSITAECATAITLNKKAEDKWEKIKDFRSLDAVVDYINKQTDGVSEYQIFLNQDIEASAKFAFPTKNKNVKSIEINGGTDRTITFTGTKLAIPYNVTFEAAIKASNKTNLIDVTVAKNAILTISGGASYKVNKEYVPYINKITGTKDSKLVLSTCVNNIATFGEVSGTAIIKGTVTGVKTFNGSLILSGEKSSAVVEKFVGGSNGGSSIVLCKNSNGVLPKVTLTAIDGKIYVAAAENEYMGVAMDYCDIDLGTAILYTKDNKFAKDGVLENIGIKSSEDSDTELSAFYYSKTKSIKAEYTDAVTLQRTVDGTDNTWADFKNFQNLEAVVDYINNTEETDSMYGIRLNKDVTASSNFAFPTKNKNVKEIVISSNNGQTLTFTGTKLNIPYEVNIYNDVLVSNKNNSMDITVAKNAHLTITVMDSPDGVPYINKVTGQSGSDMIYEGEVGSISGFEKVFCFDNTKLYGTMSKINNLCGDLSILGEKSTVDITNIYSKTTLKLYENSKGVLPKVTIGSISAKSLTVTACDNSGKELTLNGGETLLYTKDNKFADVDKITIGNNSYDDNGTKIYPLSAFYYSKTKSIKAEYTDAVTLSKKSGDNWETIKDFPNLETAVDYINGNTEDTASEYQLYLNKNVTASSTFAFPTKNKNVKGIVVACLVQYAYYPDYTITFTGNKLNIPYDVTFDVNINASNKTNLIDVTVAKNATLTVEHGSGFISSSTGYPYINKLTGQSGSKLSGDIRAYDISGFETIGGSVRLYGNMSKIGDIHGSISVSGEKSTVDITSVSEPSVYIDLIENSNGVLPKVTIAKVDKNAGLIVNARDKSGKNLKLKGGETLLYTKDNKFANIENVKIDNGSYTDDDYTWVYPMTAYYYSKTKEIKAEYADAVALYKKVDDKWKEIKDFPNLETAVDYINGNTDDPASEYGLVLNKSVTASTSFAFPTKNKNVKSITVDGSAITFTGTKLNIPYNVTFDAEIMASNYIDITVAKDVKLIIDISSVDIRNGVFYPYINKITGQSSSKLYITNALYANSISGFEDVNAYIKDSGGGLVIFGTMSKIANFNGSLEIYGEKATVDITNIYGISEFKLYENSKGVLPKVTIGSISAKSLTVTACDNSGNALDLASGRTILYTKDNKFADADKITICNNYYLRVYPLSASYDSKTKTIKAVNEYAVWLYEKKYNSNNWSKAIDYYSSFEEAVAYINKYGNESMDYRIYVAETVEYSKFALPNAKKAHKVYVETYFENIENMATINIGSTSTITANTDVDINAIFNYTSKALTLSAKGNVDIGEYSNFDKITGTTKSTLNFYESNRKYMDISGFGTVKVDEDCTFGINTTFSTNKLVLGEYASVYASENMKSGSFSELKAGEDAYIYYVGSASCTPLTFKGKAESFRVDGKLGIKGDVGYGSKILSTKVLSNPNDYFELQSDNFEATPYFKQVGNDICLYGNGYFSLNWDSNSGYSLYFNEWSDVISYINKANNPNVNYYITIAGNYNANGALTLPKKGTYKQLVMGGDECEISFTGSLKLTGNTGFDGVTLNSVNKSSGANVSYTIDGSGYDLWFDYANAPMAAITAKNVGLYPFGDDDGSESSFTASQIKAAEKMTIYSPGGACSLYVPNGIDAKNLEYRSCKVTLYLESGKKINITGEMVSTYGEGFDFVVVDKNGDELKTFSKNYSLGTIKKGADSLGLQNSGYRLEINKTTGAVTVVPEN